jgi:ABC-2 type transport system permease protein
VDAVRGLMISGDMANVPMDFMAVIAFDAVVFIVASISFRKIIE